MCDGKSEWVWPARNGRSDAEKAAEFSVGASKASTNEAMIIDGDSRDVIDMGSTVNGMQNGDMAALDSNTTLSSTRLETEEVFEDMLRESYPFGNKFSKYKRLPKLSCETQPSEADLQPIKETSTAPPLSPMCVALRDAVSSVNRIEDFEIIEEIGEGFYAKVYKVNIKYGSVYVNVYNCQDKIHYSLVFNQGYHYIGS